MADSSASCYCTSGRGKGDVIFTDINISDYCYKLKRGGVILLLLTYRLCCLVSRAASRE